MPLVYLVLEDEQEPLVLRVLEVRQGLVPLEPWDHGESLVRLEMAPPSLMSVLTAMVTAHRDVGTHLTPTSATALMAMRLCSSLTPATV